ncbi:TIGR04219 family outer membrane beta-barrel protein [Reinekea marinisedimentorum]|uniref:Outer membrane protein n=1 Tax=Reinekea marinisedimentorum TaxID=230495 RepID=A0A4R3I975_9GAMM|nr:TIGR04219 family outer membrane beta-barrel protein [Reinekea marinisedimentorum]TCS40798.1 outer membrane protein [Reinekea marinisedimentorum]
MNKYLLAASLVLAVPFASAKPMISIDAGAGWGTNGINDDSTLMDGTFDLTGDNSSSEPYGLNQEGNSGFYGWMKVSWPILPDVKVKYESMVLEGDSNFTYSETVYGEDFEVNGDVSSELDLSHLDIALTYGLPLPMVDIDLGINARSMIGGFSADFESDSGDSSVDAPFSDIPLIIPMGYISVAGTIPSTDIKLSGELSALPFGDSSVSDWNIKATWYAPLPTNMLAQLGLEAGYRSFNMTIDGELFGEDVSDYATDVTVSGFFMGAAFHF